MLAKSCYSDIIDLLESGGTLSFDQEASFIECVSYYHLMEFSHCEILLDKLISVNERFALARSLRGNLYQSIGRKRDAVVEFLNASLLDKKNQSHSRNLVNCCRNIKVESDFPILKERLLELILEDRIENMAPIRELLYSFLKIDPVFLRLKGSINKVNTDREALGLLSDCYSSEMAKVLLKLEAIQDIEIEDAICGLRRKCCTFRCRLQA